MQWCWNPIISKYTTPQAYFHQLNVAKTTHMHFNLSEIINKKDRVEWWKVVWSKVVTSKHSLIRLSFAGSEEQIAIQSGMK